MATQLKPLTWQQAAWRRVESKRLISVLLLAVLVLAVWGLGRAGVLNPACIGAYQHTHPVAAVLLFIFLFAVSILGAVPSLPLNLAAGFLWGGVAGGLYSTIGATAGGWVAFQAARHLFGQPFASRYDAGWAGRVATEFARHGWKFVAFARINPIMPTGPLNYLLGLTALSNRAFIGATFVFLLPPSIAVGYLGSLLHSVAARQLAVHGMVRDLAILSAIITSLVIVKYVSHSLERRPDLK